MRTRHVVESDPHYNKPLPEPSEQLIWKAIVNSSDYARLFLKTPKETMERLYKIASDSGVLRGLQVFHNNLNLKLTVPEQRIEAEELEEEMPLVLGEATVDNKDRGSYI